MRQRVAIIGAGYSGLALAYHLAREFDVTVFEKKPHPYNHNTTGALLYKAYGSLRAMGIDPLDVTQNPIEQAMMIYGDENYNIDWFIHCDFKQGHPFREIPEEDQELGIVRLANTATVLSALAEKCFEEGVNINYGTSYQGFQEEGNEILVTTLSNGNKETFAYDFLVGADGWNSRVAQHAGLLRSPTYHTGAEIIYPGKLNTPENTAVGVWGPAVAGGYGWMAHMTGEATEIIKNDLDGKVNLEVGKPFDIIQAGIINHKRHRTKIPRVNRLIEGIEELGLVEGSPGKYYHKIAGNVPIMVPGIVSHDRIALVGDAGNNPRNLTEEGISGAMQGAELLASYMISNPSLSSLHPYNSLFRRTVRRRTQLKEKILSALAEELTMDSRLYEAVLLLGSKYYAHKDQFTFARIQDISDFIEH